MNMLKVFEKAEFGRVRVVECEGEPWFVAKDVCECLELTDVSKTISLLDDDEKGTNSIRTPGGEQQMLVVSEPGLYSLILRSRKPEAKAFKRWVTHEILPSIRKTGHYGAPETEDEILARALVIAEGRLGMLSHAVSELQEQIALDAPKVELAEAIMETEECVSINQFAKILKQRGLDIGANRLYRPAQGRLPDAPPGNQLEHAHAADDGQGLFPRGGAYDRSRRRLPVRHRHHHDYRGGAVPPVCPLP